MTTSPRCLLPAFLAAAWLSAPAAAADFTVTTTADSGPGSLRQAILDANDSPGKDDIRFLIDPVQFFRSIPVINVVGALPEITGPLTIDGVYQIGAATSRRVQIQSTGLNTGGSILTVTSGASTLRNLCLISFTDGAVGLTLAGGGGNTVAGLLVGISSRDEITSNALHGIVIDSDDNTLTGCQIGGASGGAGIRITGSQNSVKSALIGLKRGHSLAATRASNQTGIHLLGGSGNVIGGGVHTSDESNQISANLLGGIHVEGGSGHRILGNRVDSQSIDPAVSVISNGTGNNGFGIKIDGGASDILIDRTKAWATDGSNIVVAGPADSVTISNALIAGGTNHGIHVGSGVTDLIVEDSTISFAGGAGVHLEGSSSPSGPVLIRHNLISDNKVGIDVAAGMDIVTVGTRRDSSFAVSNKIFGNTHAGVLVRDPSARVRISENAMLPINAGQYPNSLIIPINLKPDGEGESVATPNDLLDADDGPNGLQNFPVITAVEALTGGGTRIAGKLHAKPARDYVVEVLQHNDRLIAPTDMDSGFHAGFLGNVTVSTDAEGNAVFSLDVSNHTAGWKIALTATSPDGETSEYSKTESVGFSGPIFPELTAQATLSLPENEAATGTAFSLLRPAGTSGSFNASIRATARFSRDVTNPTPRPPLKYRFSPSDAWQSLNWETALQIPFAANESQRVLYLAAVDDTSWDPANKPSELFVVSGPLTFPKTIPLEFPDNDPPPIFTAINFGYGEPIHGGSAAFFEDSFDKPVIRLIADRSVTAYVTYTVSLNALQSTAESGMDFTTRDLPLSKTIFEGEGDSIQFTVNPIDDSLVEGDEIIAFNVVSATPGVTYNAVVPLVIRDNDYYRISIADASVAEGNDGTKSISFPVTISQARSGDVTLPWTTNPDTALSPSDFTGSSGTVTIAAGSLSAVITVEVNGDTEIENTEFFTVTLTDPDLADVRMEKASARGTITNDDFPSVSLAGASFPEAAGSVMLTATLSGPVPFPTSVGYTLVNGTAVRPVDFTGSASGTLTFPAGSTSATLPLTIINDTTDEPDETFTIQLGNPSGLTIATGTATVTILDNDVPSLLAPVVVNVVEGDTGSQDVAVTLRLSSTAIVEGSLNWMIGAGTSGIEAASGTVIFPPGASAATVNLTLTGNLTPQVARTATMQFSAPVEMELPFIEKPVVSITDNDQRTVTGTSVSVVEGNGGTTLALFPISIGSPLDVPVTVQYQTVDGTAKAGSDYAAATGTATIEAGATTTDIPVTVLPDGVFELTETFTLQLSAPVNAALGTASLTATITNDDAQPVIQISPSTVTSGPGGPFRAWIEVKLPEDAAALPVPVSYQVNTRNGTALAGTHYTPISGGILTFPPGEGTPVSQWIAVTVDGNAAGGATNFHLDFETTDGPSSIVTTEVKIEPLRITDFARIGFGFYTVSFPTGIAQNYVIQQASSLMGPWSDKSSVIPGSGNPVREFLLFSSESRAYFRVRSFATPPAVPAVLSP